MQLWLYKYYGDTETMRRSFNHTYDYIRVLDSNPASIEDGLGDWMPLQSTSTAYTGLGFQMISYLAFANITEILGMIDLTAEYRHKAATVATTINQRFLNNFTGAYSASSTGRYNASQGSQGSVRVRVRVRY